MKFALIKNNKVENIIIADDSFIQHIQPEWDAIAAVEENSPVSIGWSHASGEFIPPAVILQELQVPLSTNIRQLKLALLRINKLHLVPTAIASMASPEKEEVEIEWQYATDVSRTGFIVPLSKVLGISDSGLDDLFIQASQL